MSFSLGTSRNPAIIVARTPVSRAQFKTVGQLRADEAAARSGRRQASYAANRLVAVPRGVPMYAVGRGQMGRGEVKFFDVEVNNPATGNPYGLLAVANVVGHDPATAFTGLAELNAVSQGATSYNRIGSKILIKSIDVRFQLYLAGSAPANVACRYMIVYDHQPNGAFPTIANILSDNIGGATNFLSQINMANRSRFVVLRDRMIAFQAGSDGTRICKEFIKTKLETQYSATTGAIGDITSGALYLLAFASTSAAANFVMLADCHSRIRFFD